MQADLKSQVLQYLDEIFPKELLKTLLLSQVVLRSYVKISRIDSKGSNSLKTIVKAFNRIKTSFVVLIKCIVKTISKTTHQKS